ncbi:MAG: 3-deoxy-D-manno-octulosonic acid transferase [Alphaproteobacteria bacterium CG_4_9_14_3_um_filter_47_13]|nr:MAG: 3-deoxy-D-manno-octulosonic acid transferase [Alphaproteobacteria bacterium CG_4_9_14_3_um_filter_47_13]
MLGLYSSLMGASTFFLRALLNRRCRQGKEDPLRLEERMGVAGRERPEGALVWFHGASVGESQSMLILIDALLEQYPTLNILVTTGTVTSAGLMEKRLPQQAFHQYYPLDHPQWVEKFLAHWQPDLALWMESEIWPNMLRAMQKQKIPAAIVNARLSPQSFKRWKLAAGEIGKLLEAFSVCLTQTEEDAVFFRRLGAQNVIVSDNLKYSSAPLSYDEDDLKKLKTALGDRPLWLYASTHDAEEEIACRLHKHLQKKIPDLLTVIVPRHPERRDDIFKACEKYGLRIKLRGLSKKLPEAKDNIYIADTMGELGLFYRLSPIACIGRTFSHDGGGGHNPIEAAQLNCAVLHGPRIQNLAQVFEEFDRAGAALPVKTEKEFETRLERLLTDHDGMEAIQNKAHNFAQDKAKVLATVLKILSPLLLTLETGQKRTCA